MITSEDIKVRVYLREPHGEQKRFNDSKAKRKIIRAGRRSGKTVGVAIKALQAFLGGRRVLYAAPTAEQLDRFWHEIQMALWEGVSAGGWRQNESEHFIEMPGTDNRIKAKTAWNANSLRGDYANLLILDELQLMCEDIWDDVGAPMLLDNNGDAIFIYTPPSLATQGISKARDPRYCAKLFEKAKQDTTGRWEAFHFTTHDNPYISREALNEVVCDMSREAYHKEIMAEDDDLQLGLLVYNMFQERTQLIDKFDIPKEWPRHVGHDFGIANPAALFFAVNPVGDLYGYEEYLPGPGKTAPEHVAKWQDIVMGCPSVKRVGGNPNTEEETRQLYGLHGWPILAPRWKEVAQQIMRVHSLMERNKIFIFKNLVHYREELANCLWDTDNEGRKINKIKNESRYNLCASARYVLSEFNIEYRGKILKARPYC